ncbi:MAG: leucine-rich repeat domain-containing protein [Clostridia bacterium]|nr:leucine-rich repeat domain-containing protein [Clostridia bacterium]
MDKKNKLIVAIGLLIIVAATVLIIALVNDVTDDGLEENTGFYTLQPTTTQQAPLATDSWINLEEIASGLATSTDPSSTDVSGVITTGGPVQGYFFDAYGNLVDAAGNVIIPANQVNNQGGSNQGGTNNRPPETTMDNTQALDQPVTNSGELSEFELDENGVITRYLGDKKDVLIPEKIQGKYVRGIGANCFAKSQIRSVYIPETVTSIGNYAFEGCIYLTNVSFDSGSAKVNIGSGAFENCLKLERITLPVVTNLGDIAFYNCTSLKYVRLADGSKQIGSYVFGNCTALETVVIPESVDKIGTLIFEGANNPELTVVTPSDSTAWEYAETAGKKHTTHE